MHDLSCTAKDKSCTANSAADWMARVYGPTAKRPTFPSTVPNLKEDDDVDRAGQKAHPLGFPSLARFSNTARPQLVDNDRQPATPRRCHGKSKAIQKPAHLSRIYLKASADVIAHTSL